MLNLTSNMKHVYICKYGYMPLFLCTDFQGPKKQTNSAEASQVKELEKEVGCMFCVVKTKSMEKNI